MTNNQRQYSPTIQNVLTFLQQHPGEYFTAEDVCEQTDCSTGQAQMALDTLANDGVVAKEQGASGPPEYVYR